MKKTILLSLLILLTVFSQKLVAKTITIGTGGDYTKLSASESAIQPGDTVLIMSQVFSDGSQYLRDVKGTNSQPVVIIAATEHQAVFQGGGEAIHLVKCSYIELNGLVFENQTGNGVNIDDGGVYTIPTTHITIRNCIFRNIVTPGNHDFLKLSGLDDFLVENCTFTNGTSGSGIDMVGCHNGVIQDCLLDNSGASGIQMKGGTQFITIRRNILKNMNQRALNLGGSTGLQYFRPPLPNTITNAYEAADLYVYANVFENNKAHVAYVGCVNVEVVNNSFTRTGKWVIRILQETTTTGFLACSNNEFRNNIVYQEADLTEVNIGPNTNAGSFIFTNNLWYNNSLSNWTPGLPVTDSNQIIGDPLFTDASASDYSLQSASPAIGKGISLNDPTTDFIRKTYNTPRSIGAYEGNPKKLNTDYIEKTKRKIIAYPNPSKGTFKLKISNHNTKYSLTLTDIYGKKLMSRKDIMDNQLNINIKEPNGVYFLILESDYWNEVIRLIKE